MLETTPSSAVTGYPHAPRDPEHVELADYADILWRRRWLLAIGMVVSGVTVFVISRFLPPVYEASARVLISPSKVVDQSQAGTAVAPLPAVGTFQALLQNRALAAQVISKVGLDKPPHNLTAEKFATGAVTIEEIPKSNLLRVDVRARDPRIAADAANRLVLDAIVLNRTMNQSETTFVRDFLQAQLDEARTKMDQLEIKLLEYKKDHQLELRRSDADSILRERGELLKLTVEIEAERARLARAEQEITTRDRILTIPRLGQMGGALIGLEQRNSAAGDGTTTLNDPNAFPSLDRLRPVKKEATDTEEGRGARPPVSSPGSADRADDSAIGALDLRHDFINPVYEVLEYQISATRTKLAALEQRRNELITKRGLNAGNMQSFSTLYQTEGELAHLELEVGIAKTLYADLSKRYDQSRLQVAARTAELQLFDPATPPEQRIAPRPLRNAALAVAAAALVLVLVVFLAEYFAEARPERASLYRR